MSYPTVKVDALTAGRHRSAELWRGALDEFADGKSVGSLYANDFTKPLIVAHAAYADGWYQGEAGTAGAATELFQTTGDADGVVRLSAATDNDFEGVQAQAGISATVGEGIRTSQNSANPAGDVIFECRIQLSDSADDTFFVGLAEPSAAANTLVLNDNTLSLDLDYVGFYRLNGGDIQFVCRNDNNGGTAVSYAVDIVADADAPGASDWIKLGFRLNANGTGEVFVDEVRVKRTSDTNVDIVVPVGAFPIELLTRTIAVARGATGDNATIAIDADWIDCLVEDN